MGTRSYHSKGSPPVPAQLLIDFNKAALKLEDEVMIVFQQEKDINKSGNSLLSPSQVWERLNRRLNNKCLLTSTRRAITNLATRGLLRKTANSCVGHYGKSEHMWVLEE